MTIADDYAAKLARLSGDPFQSEVVKTLQRTFTGNGFQRIPDKPQGDGGLDGLSHGRTRAYCCYGLELDHGPGTLPAALRKKIVDKFKSDLRRLFELESKSSKLVPVANESLASVLGDAPKSKLNTIILITNIFEDKRLIGDLGTAFEKYKKASAKRFVHAKCELVIWGPLDFANNSTVDEQTLLRVEHPALFDVLEAVDERAKSHEPPNQDRFNQKFDELAGKLPSAREDAVAALRATFKEGWSRSILLNQELSTALPDIHQEFERVRKTAATNAHLASSKAGTDPFTLIEKARTGLSDRMAVLVNGGLPAATRDSLVEAETGRLIGECPLDWRGGDGA